MKLLESTIEHLFYTVPNVTELEITSEVVYTYLPAFM